MTTAPDETYHVELKSVGDPRYRRTGLSRTALYRLRILLKHAKRECGFTIRWGRIPPPAEVIERDNLESAMVRFSDGPAAGQMLMIRRAPLYLRVVRSGAKWDALDQLTDQASPGETITAYRRLGKPGFAMVDWTERGKRRGGCFASAIYAVVAEQPADETLRDTERWRQWCWDQVKPSTGAKHGQASESAGGGGD